MQDMAAINDRLDRIESILTTLVERHTIREWYSIGQVAQLLGKAKFTVREWARTGRIRAEKRRSGRGKFAAWVVRHSEVIRYQREGLIPLRQTVANSLIESKS